MIYVVYFSNAGTPATLLTPEIDVYLKVSDGTSAGAAPTVSELGGGFYKFTDAPSVAIVVRVDGGAGLAETDRYTALQITPNDDNLGAILAAVGALNDISVSDLLTGNLADDQVFPANSLADLLRKLFWVLCNRLRITDATGAFTGYKSDGVTPAMTGTIDDDGTTTERSAPTWP